uniref:Uncharacterized protein n=1 Tax=Solanum lycopersicum TaxID=4081 RepID=K4D0L2_SOLLC
MGSSSPTFQFKLTILLPDPFSQQPTEIAPNPFLIFFSSYIPLTQPNRLPLRPSSVNNCKSDRMMTDNDKLQRCNACKTVPMFSNVNRAAHMDPLSATNSNMQLFACKNFPCSCVCLSIWLWDNDMQQLEDKPEESEPSMLLLRQDPMELGHSLGITSWW